MHRSLLQGAQVQEIYLDEIAVEPTLSFGFQLMLLTVASDSDAVAMAKTLIQQSPEQTTPRLSEQAIIDLITTVMIYKFTTLSREELEQMLGLNLEESRVYREAEAKGRREEGRLLILRLLTEQVGELPSEVRQQVEALEITQLENLGSALLRFRSFADLVRWLEALPQG